jgi:hypothetical protein
MFIITIAVHPSRAVQFDPEGDVSAELQIGGCGGNENGR